jgi:tungstate transport system substrate-binding protein
MKTACLFAVGWLTAALVTAAPPSTPATQPLVRCAVIGGMMESDFWPQLAERFENQTGIHVDVVASGQRTGIGAVFARGGVDLITMHACDTVLNLVADGYAADPQPWARNDLVLIGPADDPAGVKGMTDPAAAIKKIVAAKAQLVVHSSLGAQEVLRNITDAGDIILDPDHTTILLDDHQRQVLHIAAEKKAYTLVGRIPFLSGRLPSEGMIVMVAGDPRLRRPYLVAVANPAKITGAHLEQARQLAAFLRDPQTQKWIATFGVGKYDERPLFFPVETARSEEASSR